MIQPRRLLLQATRTVERLDAPGVETTYYPLHSAEAVVPKDTARRTLLAPGARVASSERSTAAGLLLETLVNGLHGGRALRGFGRELWAMGVPTSTFAGCARRGSEPGLLGHETWVARAASEL